MTLTQTGMQIQQETVRIGTVAAVPLMLKRLGFDPADVLATAGLNQKLFDDPDNVITHSCRNHLLKVCVDMTGCSHFGLLIGQKASLSSLGLIGYLALHSPNAGSALKSLVHYFHLHGQGTSIDLAEKDDMVFLSYNIYQSGIEANEQIEDGAVAIAFNIMRTLCGDKWRPTEVRFAHRKPENTGPFRKFFHAQLCFNSEQNGVLFPAKWLNEPVIGADPDLHRLLQKQVDQLEVSHSDNFPNKVRRVLHTVLLTGHVSADQIAALFSIHKRTLNRRLKAYNTSYKELVDQTRYEIAKQMIERSSVEMIQIATTLGYTDASAFSRAFRRWSGTTPSVWRARRSDTTSR